MALSMSNNIQTILLIDDNPSLLANLSEILTLEGFTVLTAANGEEGIQTLQNAAVDLIICDFEMPVLDGGEVLKYVRQDGSKAGLPFILISANQPPEGLADYAFTFLAKPLDLNGFLKTIRAL